MTDPGGRPTDNVRPAPSDVAGLLASRFGPGGLSASTRPNASQVAGIIDQVASELDAEMVNVAVTPALATLATWCITLAAAATVELEFFPEQNGAAGDVSGILWARYQAALGRFRQLLAMEGGGPSPLGSTRARSHTAAAWDAVVGVPLQTTVVPGTQEPIDWIL